MDLGVFAIGETIHFRVNTVNKTGSGEDATSGPAYRVRGFAALTSGRIEANLPSSDLRSVA